MFITANSFGNIIKNDIDELKELEIIGFNHIPNTRSNIMENTILHKAETRGDADHGWLHSKHTFSFANYYNPERMHFGVLRVLNDDTVSGGMGFGTHPHDNMEIISIPLEGDLEILETKPRLVATEFPMKRANIAVPIPSEPPSNFPMIRTANSTLNRAREILIPVRRWIEVMRPSLGPGPIPQVI